MPERSPAEPPSDSPSPSATRDLLANERTLLAWARTSIAIMGLGFVVARFGLVIRELAGVGVRQLPRGVSTAFGVALTLAGALVLVLAYVRYRQVANAILHNRVHRNDKLAVLMTALLVLTGLLLALYLLLTG